MITAINSEVALKNRETQLSRTSGREQWRTPFIGPKVKQVEDIPQAFLVELGAHGDIQPHFHQVNQYQVLVAGSGNLGRNEAPLIALHYADHHTAYGPIVAGPCGLTLFTIRQKADPGGFYLHEPGYKEKLKPTKKRYLLAQDILLSTAPVLESRTQTTLDSVFDHEDEKDGLGAYMLRMGGNAQTAGPDPRVTGGQYYLVLNGSLQHDGQTYPAWSTIYAGPDDAPLAVNAGPLGLEALVLNFPRWD